MKRPKTQTEKLAEKNAKAVAKHREDVRATAELQKRVARGELTAAEALMQRMRAVQAKEDETKTEET